MVWQSHKVGKETIADVSSAVGFTAANYGNATSAVVTVTGADVRVRIDGSAPTATSGVELKENGVYRITTSDLSKVKFLEEASSAALAVTFHADESVEQLSNPNPSVETLTVSGAGTVGGALTVTGEIEGSQVSVVPAEDATGGDWKQKHYSIDITLPATTDETAQGFELPAEKIVECWLDITTAETTGTIDIGTATGSGDPNGLFAAQAIDSNGLFLGAGALIGTVPGEKTLVATGSTTDLDALVASLHVITTVVE